MFDKHYIDKLFEIVPTIKSLLREAPTVREARMLLRTYFNEYSAVMNRRSSRLQPLEWDVQITCLNTLRRVVTLRSERLSKFSLVSVLWKMAHGHIDDLPDDLENGFFEELIHLFKGLQGKSGIYLNEEFPEFSRLSGRDAAIVRSNKLDDLANVGKQFMSRYSNGLQDDVIERRKENRDRILSE